MHGEFQHFQRRPALAYRTDLAACRALEDRHEAFVARRLADFSQAMIGEFDFARPQPRERCVVAGKAQQVAGELRAGCVDRRAERGRLRRAAGKAREWQAGVTDPDRHVVQRQAEAVRSVLSLHRGGAHAHLMRGAGHRRVPIAVDSDFCRHAGHARVRKRAGGAAHADQPFTVLTRSRLRHAALPAETLGTEFIGQHEIALRMRRAADRIAPADVPSAQGDRIDTKFMRQLIHRALDGESAHGFAGRAHKCVGEEIEIERVLHDVVAFRGIERATCQREGFIAGTVRLFDGIAVMEDRRQLAIGCGGECHALLGLRAATDQAMHARA